MALVISDRVKETTTTTGTGTITLGGAIPNFETFTSNLSDGDTTYYAIVDGTNNAFEVGLGTFTASGTTLARTTIIASSNSNNAVDFAAGTKEVFITVPADKMIVKDANGDIGVSVNTDASAEIGRAHIGNVGHSTMAGFSHIVHNSTTDYALLQDGNGTTYLNAHNGRFVNFRINNTDIMRMSSLGLYIFPDKQIIFEGSTSDSFETFIGAVDPTADRAINFPNASGTISLTTATETLTNKTLTTPVIAEIDNSGDITLDAGGDIVLDAAGNDIFVKYNGTSNMRFTFDGNGPLFEVQENNKDFSIGFSQSGAPFTALRLDGSANGNAIFNGSITAPSLDISGNVDIDGTLEADAITVNGTALATVIAGTTVTNVTVSDSTANTNFPVVFHDESNGLLDDTGALRYNPSTGELLVPKLTVAGTTTTVDTVTMNAQNAVVFEGATADANETTLTIVDPTADRTITLPDATGQVVLSSGAIDTSASAEIGRAHIGHVGYSDVAGFSHVDFDSTTGYALLQTSSGNTHLNAADTKEVFFKIGNGEIASISANGLEIYAGKTIAFEGSTLNTSETTLTVANPTADRTITLPDATGTVSLVDATETLTNKTLTTPVINGFSGTGDGSLIGDLTAKSSDGAILKLQTSETTIVDGDVLGAIEFSAPDEGDGADGDARLVGAAIVAEADDTFTDTVNDTDLVIKLGGSETAIEKARFSQKGGLKLTGADADANPDPTLTLFRDSASPADGDFNGSIYFSGTNSADEDFVYVAMLSQTVDVTDGTEDGRLIIRVAENGTPAWSGSASDLIVLTPDTIAFDASSGTTFGGHDISNVGNLSTTGDITAKTSDGAILKLQTSDTSVVNGNVLGAIEFSAPDESSGGDGITTAFSIIGEAQGSFTSGSNATDLVFDADGTEILRLEFDGDALFPSGAVTIRDNTGGILNLQTTDVSVSGNQMLGEINFRAPFEASGGDADNLAASIVAQSVQSFTSTNNSTDILFKMGVSETATEKMRFTHDGTLEFADAGGSIGLISDHDMIIFNASDVTVKDNDLIVNTSTGGILKLQTSDTTVADGDVLGSIEFNAPSEDSGTDAITTAASIVAEADNAFSATINATDLVFKLGASGAATEKMRLEHEGTLKLGSDTVATREQLKGDATNGAGVFSDELIARKLHTGTIITKKDDNGHIMIAGRPNGGFNSQQTISANRGFFMPIMIPGTGAGVTTNISTIGFRTGFSGTIVDTTVHVGMYTLNKFGYPSQLVTKGSIASGTSTNSLKLFAPDVTAITPGRYAMCIAAEANVLITSNFVTTGAGGSFYQEGFSDVSIAPRPTALLRNNIVSSGALLTDLSSTSGYFDSTSCPYIIAVLADDYTGE